ncbi:Galactoside 2-alpha-L-fucosyltransferase [Linum perenne]
MGKGSSSGTEKSNRLLGGLLSAGFEESSCQSRYKSHLLRRKPSPHQPSKHLISKLRSYEKLHKRCGPRSRNFRKLTKSPRLMNTTTSRSSSPTTTNGTLKAILVASLSSEYADNLRTKYWTTATAMAGEKVGVFQASQEGVQRFKNEIHNVKAWAEIYLLSLCDLLVTSGQSTFGYVGQGLGDVKPWILEKQLDANIPDPPCWLGVSTEPCFHFPPEKECAAAAGRRRSGGERWNVSSKFEYLKPCEDLSFGVKLMQ